MLVDAEAAAAEAAATTSGDDKSVVDAMDDFALLRWVCLVSPAVLASVVISCAPPPLSMEQVASLEQVAEAVSAGGGAAAMTAAVPLFIGLGAPDTSSSSRAVLSWEAPPPQVCAAVSPHPLPNRPLSCAERGVLILMLSCCHAGVSYYTQIIGSPCQLLS